ncbi:phospholipase A2 inhibitor and Ly6/PLAUR domain-containing protein-like [Leptodactylus fuscus]|uniref:phospholipase A2 inhibitor and Ly6/PLAUR domain-containing protein-like n=1 Tax=Leptodactylus fuscus TaxID=238119 RepID=UPI003F4F3A4F
MTSLIRILSLLSALTATSSALSCTECTSTNSTCSGTSMTCPSGSLCGSSFTETTTDGTRIPNLVRTCVPSNNCDFKGSISLKEAKVRIVISCCSTDNCTPTLPPLPTRSSKPNGVVCPSCLSFNSTSCETSDTIQCTGEENRCFFQTTRVTGSVSVSASSHGCATKSVCDFGGQSIDVEGTVADVTFTCASGGLSVHKVILTPAIVCLLLLKFFF